MSTAYIGLGANLDAPKQQVIDAIAAIAAHPNIKLLGQSKLYGSVAVGPGTQDNYCNAAVKVETNLTAADLLAQLHQIEAEAGRVRKIRWGARTLDLDLLLYDAIVSNTPQLMLPHPRIEERNFVVKPLFDLNSSLELKGGIPIKLVLESLGEDNLWEQTDE